MAKHQVTAVMQKNTLENYQQFPRVCSIWSCGHNTSAQTLCSTSYFLCQILHDRWGL